MMNHAHPKNENQAKPKVYTALGLMSGTSLDGIDAAILRTDGEMIFDFGPGYSRAFSDKERHILQEVTQVARAWEFDGPPTKELNHLLDAAEALIDRLHLDVIGHESFKRADLVGYHGQTILHQPPLSSAQTGNRSVGRSLQLGRGQVLADRLDLPVVFDFRSEDILAGGQGAPLAPIYHQALCRFSNLSNRVAVINIGGVANISAVADGDLQWASDSGPGNGPLDSWMEARTGTFYDQDGQAALAGTPNQALIATWLERDFFKRPIPRSADRYDFDVLADLSEASIVDGAATLAEFCAQAIARDLRSFAPDMVIICGGGRYNPAIMGALERLVGTQVVKAEDMGWDGDFLEAQAFAYLAVRTKCGLPISFPMTTGAPQDLTGGRLVKPTQIS